MSYGGTHDIVSVCLDFLRCEMRIIDLTQCYQRFNCINIKYLKQCLEPSRSFLYRCKMFVAMVVTITNIYFK